MRLEPLDYLHLMSAVRWTGIERFVAWLAAVGITGMGAVATLILLDPLTDRLPAYPYWDWAYAAAGAGALVGFLIYKVFVMGPYVDSMFYGQPIGMGETTVVADATGVNSTVAGISWHVPWDKIQDVVVGKEHLFLMFGRVVGVIVPRRAFADSAEAERFADYVRSMTRKPA